MRIGFCFCSHGNAIVPFHSFLFSPCQFFQQQLHPRMRLGQKSYPSVFWTSLAPHCLFTRERNDTIAYRSTFRITYFIAPYFGTERCYFKRSRVNATPERSTFRNGTIWNGTIAFPCERGLSFLSNKPLPSEPRFQISPLSIKPTLHYIQFQKLPTTFFTFRWTRLHISFCSIVFDSYKLYVKSAKYVVKELFFISMSI